MSQLHRYISSLLKMKQAIGDEKSPNLVEEADEASVSKVVEGPEDACHNVNDLKMLDFNSADAVRQMAKEVLRAGEKLDLIFEESNDATETANPVDKGDEMQIDLPAKLASSVQNVSLPLANNKTQSKLDDNPVLPGKSNKRNKRKKKSKFVNSCKRASSVSKFYTGKLSNLVKDFQREERRCKRSESSSYWDRISTWL